jgi:hypothetical protein
MFLPEWLRRFRLRRALRGYPLYDPPHKVEERLLSKAEAAENFDYFMRVRKQRMADFLGWLQRHFGIIVTLDRTGVKVLCRWGQDYAGLLLLPGSIGDPKGAYFTYDPPWAGENAGLNVLFDMGITLGEAIIANCPKLRWDFDPISALLPRTGEWLKQTPGTSFQRPELTGFDDAITRKMPLLYVSGFADEMAQNFYRRMHPDQRWYVAEFLVVIFDEALRDYPAGDPYYLREPLAQEDYLALTDGGRRLPPNASSGG